MGVGVWKRRRRRCMKTRKRYIVYRSCHTLLRLRLRPHRHYYYSEDILMPPRFTKVVKIGDTFDIFPLLFTNPRDFLVSNNPARVRVKADDVRGRTILVYMLPLGTYNPPGGLCRETLALISSYKERDFDFDFEVIFVPIHRGQTLFRKCDRNRYYDFFSKMPWPAVPFTNKLACHRVHEAFRYPLPEDPDPCWLLLDPRGTVLLTSDYAPNSDVFSYYGIGELVPRMHMMLPRLSDAQRMRGSVNDQLRDWLLNDQLREWLHDEDEAVTRGVIDLEKLLASPSPRFLLAKDGTEVPLSYLKDKVVGLYFCNHASGLPPPHMESIKEMYEEVVQLGYDFEIVQINFHSSRYLRGSEGIDINVPWLTLPYTHSCCKRLVRIFKCHKGVLHVFPREDRNDKRDRLVIINPREPSFDRHGTKILRHFGIEAYPFTRQRVFELEYARRKEETKLQKILSPSSPPMLRRRGGSYDRVPTSHLWGKRVILVFATHSKYKSSQFMSVLETKYLEQDKKTGIDAFEVVYISYDTNASTFDESTSGMPWLVHPYSWEFADMWRSRIFGPRSGRYGLCLGAAFHVDGEFISKNECSTSVGQTEYPFFLPANMKYYITEDVYRNYGLRNF